MAQSISVIYQIHGDDSQGATIVTTEYGQTYWLMPYQGHNRLYEIKGWQDWRRQSGPVQRPASAVLPALSSKSFTARYYKGAEPVLETIEPPIYYERFGKERHSARVTSHYKVIWTGSINPPVADRFQFHSFLGPNEQIAVWIDGHIVHANGFGRKNVDSQTDLVAVHRHAIRIEYIKPDSRAELKLLWSSRTIDPQRSPTERLHSS